MAEYITDEERKERIIKVAEHVIVTGDSTRKTSNYFSENEFPISNFTVCDYCKRYVTNFHGMYPEKVEQLIKRITANTAKDKDVDITKRVLLHAEMLLTGLTIEEISEKNKTPYWTVYRDITVTLRSIDEKLYQKCKETMKMRSNENLKHNR